MSLTSPTLLTKRLALCVFTFFAVLSSNAQWKTGVKAGLNLSNFKGLDGKAGDWKAGMNAGFLIRTPGTEKVFWQFEFLYTQKGLKGHPQYPDTITTTVSYIGIPIMPVFKITERFHAYAGPEFAIKLNEKYSGGTYNQRFRSFDLSIIGGLAYYTSMGLGVETRFQYGLAEVYNGVKRSSSGDVLGTIAFGHNMVAQLNAVYIFDGKHK